MLLQVQDHHHHRHNNTNKYSLILNSPPRRRRRRYQLPHQLLLVVMQLPMLCRFSQQGDEEYYDNDWNTLTIICSVTNLHRLLLLLLHRFDHRLFSFTRMDDGERPTSSPTTSPIVDEMSSPTTSPTTVVMKCLNYKTFILENTDDDDDDDDDKIIINSLKVAKCPQLHSVAFWLCLRRQNGRDRLLTLPL